MDRIKLGDDTLLSWEESQAFVAQPLCLLTEPRAVVGVPYKKGTIAVFDNRAMVHTGTPAGPGPQALRVMHRISKTGRWIPYPTSLLVERGNQGAGEHVSGQTLGAGARL